MEISSQFDRALLLFNQHRPEQAEELLRQILVDEPDFGPAHSMLALCIIRDRDRLKEATQEAEAGIANAPHDAYTHYVLAIVLDTRNRYDEALNAIEQALALDPEEATYFAKQSELYGQKNQWLPCLESAEQGLQFDAENEACQMLRSLALERLGRVEDSVQEAERAVANDPDNSYAHSSLGWALLQNRQFRKAQEAFREALRLEPNNEMARQGMIQALNSNNPIYRWTHQFMSWLSRLSASAQLALIIGLVVVINTLNNFADQNPALQPYIMPITMLYIVFVLLTWIANPLFNTLLRFNQFGKHLLSRKEKWASNIIAATLFTGVALSAACYFLHSSIPLAAGLGLLSLYLVVPISIAFNTDEGWPSKLTIAIAVVFVGLYLAIAYYHLFDLAIVERNKSLIGGLINTYQLGILVYCFVGPRLQQVQVRN